MRALFTQDIELAKVRLDARHRRRDGLDLCDIQFDEPHVGLFAREGLRSLAAGHWIACPEQDDVTRRRGLARATSKPIPLLAPFARVEEQPRRV
jgi:hypothetical protein